MHKAYLLFSILLQPLFIAAQSNGDYRSVSAGNWENASNWERYNGAAWAPAPSAPAITDGVITIRPLFGITVTTSFSIDQVVIAGGASLTISSTLTLTDGPGVELTCDGSLPITGGTLTISTGAEFVWNAGNINFNNATLNNSGTITATQNAGNLSYISGSALFTNNTGAVFEKSGGTTTSNININNDGTFRITNTDALFNVIANTFYNYGTIDLIGYTSTFQNSSVLNLYAGTQITGQGTLLLSSGSHILNDPITINGPDLDLTGGTMEGAGSLTTTAEGINTMTWQGGTINATVTIQNFMEIYGPVILSDTLNVNNAHVEWESGNINFADGVINNNNGSLFRADQNAEGLSHLSGINVFNNNSGANFEIAGGDYSTANITINNAGVFRITDDDTEFLQTGNTFNNSGTINLSNQFTQFRNLVILNLNVGTQIIGEGRLFLGSTGFHNLNSEITVNEPRIYASGTIQGQGSLTARHMTWAGGTINAPVTINEVVEVSGPVTLSDTLTITNSAGMHWEFGNINFTGGILNNNGIIYAYDGAAGLVHGSGTNAFNNNSEATFLKIGGTVSTANIPIYNFGIFEVNSDPDSSAAYTAFHQLGNSFNNSGAIHIIASTSVFKNEAVLNLNTGTEITGNGTLLLASTTFHNVNTAVTINTTLLVRLSAGTLDGQGSLTSEFFFWSGGTIKAPVTIAYNMIVQGSSFTLSDTLTILNGALLEWNSGNINFAGGTLSNNDLIFAKQNAGGLIHVSGTNTFNNNSGATFEKIGGTVSTASISINNAGIFKIDSDFPSAPNTGFSQTGSSFNNTGTINLLGSSSTFQNGSTLNLNDGTQVTGTGSLLLVSTTFHNVNTEVTITSAVVKLLQGTLQGPGLLTTQGMLWNGGTIDGTVVITNSLVLQGSIVVLSDTLTINSGAEMLWESGNINFNNGILNNDGDIIANEYAYDLVQSSGTNAFNNNGGGTFKKTGGDITKASIPVNNAGTFIIDSGVNHFRQEGGKPFTNTGTINLVSYSSVFISASILNLNAGTQFIGEGTLYLQSTFPFNLAVDINMPNPIEVSLLAGTLQGAGTLTINGSMVWQGGTIDAHVMLAEGSLLHIENNTGVSLTSTLTIGYNATAMWDDTNINFTDGILENHGTIWVTADKTMASVGGFNKFSNEFYGNVIRTSPGTTTINVPTENYGIMGGGGTYSFGGSLINAGVISPGQSPGICTINSLTSTLFSATSILNIEIQDSTGPGTGHDQLQRNGNLTLDGTLIVLQTGDVPIDSFIIISLTAGVLSGSFDTLNLPPGYTSGQASNTFYVIKTSNALWKYRSKQSGNWNALSTWESSVDGINWANATQLPTEFNAELVTTRNGHTVTVSNNTQANKIVAESGSSLILSSGTLTILMQ